MACLATPVGAMRSICLAAWMVPALFCAGARADVVPARSALIYGADDRRDIFAASDMGWRTRAIETSLALVRREDIVLVQEGEVVFEAPSLGEAYGLCPTERFVEQPALAQCSGVLVDDDLVLTAAHCLEPSSASCEQQRWVFDYALQHQGDTPQLRADGVFACRSVPLRRLHATADQRLDFAFVQLDRPVPGLRRAAALAQEAQLPLPSDSVCVIGYPSGLPSKIDCGAKVIDDRSAQRDYLSLTSDTSVGSSGSGVFDLQRRLVAVLSRGARDYEPAQDGRRCRVARAVSAVNPQDVVEQATYVAPAVRELCESGWKSQRLCNAAGRCGDGQCSSDEHPADCPQDCPQLAVWSETRVAASCHASRLTPQPHSATRTLWLMCAYWLVCTRRLRVLIRGRNHASTCVVTRS